MANVFGNKALFNANYEAYKTVKIKEAQTSAAAIKKMVQKYNVKGNKSEYLIQTADNLATPVKQFLILKIAYLTWRRYLQMYDDCDKDSVDIDSGDFELSELRLNEVEEELKLKQNHNRGSVVGS